MRHVKIKSDEHKTGKQIADWNRALTRQRKADIDYERELEALNNGELHGNLAGKQKYFANKAQRDAAVKNRKGVNFQVTTKRPQ